MAEVTALSALESVTKAEVFETPRPRTVRLQLNADQQIPPHRHPGTNIVLYLIEGRVALGLDEDEFELAAGELVRFSGNQDTSPTAIDPATAILVFASQPDSDQETTGN